MSILSWLVLISFSILATMSYFICFRYESALVWLVLLSGSRCANICSVIVSIFVLHCNYTMQSSIQYRLIQTNHQPLLTPVFMRLGSDYRGGGCLIGNQIYCTLLHVACDYTSQLTATHTLLPTVMSSLPLLGSGFQDSNRGCSHPSGFLNGPCASATATLN